MKVDIKRYLLSTGFSHDMSLYRIVYYMIKNILVHLLASKGIYNFMKPSFEHILSLQISLIIYHQNA